MKSKVVVVYLDVITNERDMNNIIISFSFSTLWIWSSEIRRSIQCCCLSLIQRCLLVCSEKKKGKINGGCFIIGKILRGLFKDKIIHKFSVNLQFNIIFDINIIKGCVKNLRRRRIHGETHLKEPL